MSNAETWAAGEDFDVAIIGLAGRFPGARNLEEFWCNLRDGVESVKFFSDEELRAAGVDAGLLDDATYVKARAVLDDIEQFDASFFGLSPSEAEIMDPQHRLFLECAWEALENAGYGADNGEARVGVFAGAGIDTYLLHNLYANRGLLGALDDLQVLVANDKDTLTTRVSYKLNLKGPSVTVQTSCSSSLVAVHMACQSLLSYQCNMALAGGVKVQVPQTAGHRYRAGSIMSPDGHCRAFDVKAQGTVGGSGVGVVVLKRLSAALEDGDHIHAVIKGSAVNNDGSGKVSFLAPSVRGQAAVVAEAQAVAGVEPQTLSYVEAHGTATALGDPIEVAALTQAFRAGGARGKFCALGSVKTNIGHLDTAAGVAGLIKTVLALRHRQLPPSLHFTQPHPDGGLADSPFYVNAQLRDWQPSAGAPRRAGVSSFGIGGTNAHLIVEEPPVIVEEPPAVDAAAAGGRAQLLLLSAKTPGALATAASNLRAQLEEQPDSCLADAAYTLQVGRRAFAHRQAVVCRSVDEAVSALAGSDGGHVTKGFSVSDDRPVVFMFTGQGAQRVNMGLGFYQLEPEFRAQVDRCAELLRPHLSCDLREVLYPRAGQEQAAAAGLNRTALTQPALFVFEYALAQLWLRRGVRPQAMIGHSIGEFVAACLAGVMSLEDALWLVAARGRLMQEMPEGAMLAVALSEAELRPLLGRDVSLAAVNAPARCIVAGDRAAVAALSEQLRARGVWSRPLQVSHAFHSAMMNPVLERFTELVGQVALRSPEIPFISNITGTWITAAEATSPRYWADHLRGTVRFAEGIGELLREPARVLLEVGPGDTLSSLARQQAGTQAGQAILASLPPGADDETPADVALLGTAGRLWLAGASVDWPALHEGARRRRVPLPTYPFERRRYWIEPPSSSQRAARGPEPAMSGRNPNGAEWFYVPSWQRTTLPEAAPAGESGETAATWLVLVDECGLGARLVAGLQQRQQRVITVRAGRKLRAPDAQQYTIDPHHPEDYRALLDKLSADGQTPHNIVHMWSIKADAEAAPPSPTTFAAAQADGLYSLLFLAQALGRPSASARLRLFAITNNMQEVTGDELLRPEKATLLSPCKIIPQEWPNITCRSIDVVLPAPDTRAERRLTDQLLAEVTAQQAAPVVAYRGAYRWAQSFEPLRVPAEQARPRRLRERGVYLITGGLGRAGLLLANYLARTAQARLVLVDTAVVPPEDEWAGRSATPDERDGCGRRIRQLQALAASGGEFLIINADVADAAAMRQAITQAARTFGRIDGVVHAAGVEPEGTTIDEARPEVFTHGFRTHVNGLLVLAEELPEGLDFCLLLSSLSAILGGLGHVAYAAANLFMDAFAHRQNRRGTTHWLSANWETWGLAETATDRPTFGAHRAQLSLTDEEMLETFRRVLSLRDVPQVVISTEDLRARMARWLNPTAAADTTTVDAAPFRSTPHPRPGLPQTYSAPSNETEVAIAGIWQSMLGISAVGRHDNFFELGGDSLLATRVAARLRETFNIELPLRRFFDAPTVAGLAAFVVPEESAPAADLAEIDSLLREIEGLTAQEVRDRLAEEM